MSTTDKQQRARERRHYKLAIKALVLLRSKDIGRADAARYGFAWAIKAKLRVDEINEAIDWFEDLLED